MTIMMVMSSDQWGQPDLRPQPSRGKLRDRYDLVVQIIDRRRELHLTQQQVAAASGLHQSVVSRIEQGVANPTARTLAVLARALDAKLTLTGRQA